jgi:hypothetical protein
VTVVLLTCFVPKEEEPCAHALSSSFCFEGIDPASMLKEEKNTDSCLANNSRGVTVPSYNLC